MKFLAKKNLPEDAVPRDRVLKTLSTFAVDIFESLLGLKYEEGSYELIYTYASNSLLLFTVLRIRNRVIHK